MRLRAFWLFGLAASRRSCGSAFRTKCALLDEDRTSKAQAAVHTASIGKA